MRFFRAALLVLVAYAGALCAAEPERTGGPFVPTPQVVVDAMLGIAKVGAGDFVVDLGSGDGRIVLTAAQRYGARGIGVEIDPELVAQSNAEAQRRGVADRASFLQQDVLLAKLSDATVVTLYLLPGMMDQLQAKLVRELKPGTRIVSHDFSFGQWKPDREESVDVPEKYGTAGLWKSTVYYWVVPARIGGLWTLSAPGLLGQPLALTLEQQYQFLSGSARVSGRNVSIAAGKVDGTRVTFKLELAGGMYDFSGAVEQGRMRGQAVRGTHAVAWRAEPAGKQTAAAAKRARR